MATLPISEELWTVQEYLSTSWSPDREFVEGRIEERNLGEKDHSILQRYFTVLFYLKRDEWGVEVFPELRTQTQARRFRVPDVLVVRTGDSFQRYITRPPLIAIEVLSPEDTLRALQAKSDPEKRQVCCSTTAGLELVESGELTVPETPIRVVLSEMFAELDRL